MYYRVQWSYSSSLTTAYGGQWGEGRVIDLPDALATAINADSPGVLVAVPKHVEPDPGDVAAPTERMAAPALNRQAKPARNRAAGV